VPSRRPAPATSLGERLVGVVAVQAQRRQQLGLVEAHEVRRVLPDHLRYGLLLALAVEASDVVGDQVDLTSLCLLHAPLLLVVGDFFFSLVPHLPLLFLLFASLCLLVCVCCALCIRFSQLLLNFLLVWRSADFLGSICRRKLVFLLAQVSLFSLLVVCSICRQCYLRSLLTNLLLAQASLLLLRSLTTPQLLLSSWCQLVFIDILAVMLNIIFI